MDMIKPNLGYTISSKTYRDRNRDMLLYVITLNAVIPRRQGVFLSSMSDADSGQF